MAVPANAEVIPDTDTGGTGTDEQVNEQGLNAEEAAAFADMMRETSGEAAAEPRVPADGATAPAGDTENEDGEEGGEEDETLPEAATDVDPAAADPAAPRKQQPKTVSYGKHQRQLGKAKRENEGLAQQLDRERADRIKLGERLAILNEALTAAPTEGAEKAPVSPMDEADVDPNKDVWKALDQSNRRIKYIAENLGGMQQQTAEQRADNELRSHYLRDAQAFGARPETSDFPAAYDYLKDSRILEIAMTEFDKDPRDENAQFTAQQIARIVEVFNAEEKWLAETAFREGRSPAAAVYKLAKARGYVTAKPGNDAANGAAKPANGAAAPATPARAAPARAPVASEMDRLRRAQENGKSLSDGGSTTNVTALTPERLLAMGDEDFDNLIDSLSPRKLQELLGRDATQ